MSIRVTIPAPLRRFTAEEAEIEIEAETIFEIISCMEEKYPGFRSRLCDENGELKRFFNIYVDGEDIRFLENLETNLGNGAEVSIIPAISGG